MGIPLLVAVESGPGLAALYKLVFAGTTASADSIVTTWSESDRHLIAFANGLDYLFGLALFLCLSLACSLAGRASAKPSLAAAMAWLGFLGVALDVPENAAYLALLLGTSQQPFPAVALGSSLIRHSVLISLLIFLIIHARGLAAQQVASADRSSSPGN